MRDRLPYRARDGLILGVCKGLARALEVKVWVVRTLAILGLMFSGVWPMLFIYLALALLMPLEPAETADPKQAAGGDWRDADTAARVQRLEERLRRLEDLAVRQGPDRERDWDRRFERETNGR